MFPQTQKHTLGRLVDLDVTQKYSIFKGSDVKSIQPSQRVWSKEEEHTSSPLYSVLFILEPRFGFGMLIFDFGPVLNIKVSRWGSLLPLSSIPPKTIWSTIALNTSASNFYNGLFISKYFLKSLRRSFISFSSLADNSNRFSSA